MKIKKNVPAKDPTTIYLSTYAPISGSGVYEHVGKVLGVTQI